MKPQHLLFAITVLLSSFTIANADIPGKHKVNTALNEKDNLCTSVSSFTHFMRIAFRKSLRRSGRRSRCRKQSNTKTNL